jgi:hypothetical protein
MASVALSDSNRSQCPFFTFMSTFVHCLYLQLGFRVQFFIGEPGPEDLHCAASLPAENKEEGDLVILPLIESYENLTQKILGMMTYVGKCNKGKFYAKCDDDVFVYAHRLQSESQAHCLIGCAHSQTTKSDPPCPSFFTCRPA